MFYTKQTSKWKNSIIPYPLPDFRIYLHPDDRESGKLVLAGNLLDYDLSSIERDTTVEEVDEDQTALFCTSLDCSSETLDDELAEGLENIEHLDSDITDDLKDDDPAFNTKITSSPRLKSKQKPKKRKRSPVVDEIEDVEMEMGLILCER